jgi:Na+/H+ antiporter NhaD/arsenite permease-like protein
MTHLVATLIFVATLALILTDRVHRLIAGAMGAAVMLAAGHLLGFYTEEQAIAAIDFETLGLLLGMMILVRLLEHTGFFQYLAIVTARQSGGRPWRLLLILGATTTVTSMFLDNVTTVVLIAPVTILIAEILGLNSVPLLIAEALLSNTGGIATLIGDPPNVLIGSAADLSFLSFLTHLAPIVAVIWLAALLVMRGLFRVDLGARPTNLAALAGLNARESLHDRRTLRRTLIVLAGTLALFFAQGALGLSPAFVALTGAAVALAWIQPDVENMLKGLEWSVLLFFAALFVTVGGLESAGVLHGVSDVLRLFNTLDPVLLGLIVIWSVALLSAIVDNIPITIAMIPVIAELGTAGVNVTPLWWALALGAGLGGNGTIIGSTANVIVVSISERTRTPITSRLWLKRGLPVMLATLVVASVLYALTFGWMSTR